MRPSAVGRLRGLLPHGAGVVGAGLIGLGASSYVYLTVGARTLGPDRFAGVSVLYVLIFTVGPGLFLPLEQELARAVADRRARGIRATPVVVRVTELSGAALLGLLVIGAATAPLTVHRAFDGSWGLSFSLLGAIAAMWMAYLVRGLLAGVGSFSRYGLQLGVEGALRVAGVVAFAVFGVRAPGWYGVLLVAPIALSLLVTGPGLTRELAAGRAEDWQDVSGALRWLLVGSLASQLLVNVGPVLVKVTSSRSDRAAAGQLLAGLVLARLPLFAFAAVQAALLPKLAEQLAVGHVDQFALGLRRLSLAAGAAGLAGTLVLAGFGSGLIHLFFGSGFGLRRLVLVELGAGSMLYMVSVILGQALVALRRYRLSAAGWVVGILGFAVTAAAWQGIVTRVAVGFLVGTGAVLVWMTGATMSALGSERRAMQTAASRGGE